MARLTQLSASEQNAVKHHVRVRPGPKPKSIKDRVLKSNGIQPIRKQERSWSQKQKIRALVFLYHHRIPLATSGKFRPPTQAEASLLFGIPQRTLSDWVRKQDQIELVAKGSSARTVHLQHTICKWPELERQLYCLFLECREKGQAVRRGWFRLHSDEIFRKLFPSVGTQLSLFRFSNGWFARFLGRYRISLRCITKTAQKIPEDYRNLIISWLQFNRRNSQFDPYAFYSHRVPVGGGFIRRQNRYDLANICNLDETPIPFEYLSGRTYNLIGDKTIWVKETRSGWDKRQASLVLCIFADGVNRIPPMIIFHGQGKRLGKEQAKYHPGVLVEFNDTAYMTEVLFIKYIEMYLIPALNGKPSLFAMDLCTSHKTPAVLEILRSKQITPTLIPAGCTSLVQPLDVSINKPLKEYIRTLTEEAIRDCESLEKVEKWTVSDRRILTTWSVGDAWYLFAVEKDELIRRVFRKVGLSLAADGSQDEELDIKGFKSIEIGDWKLSGSLPATLPVSLDFADVDIEHDENESVEFIAYGE